MPPKKAPNAKDIKKKQKVVEDKTFGMKNKKGGKAQKVVQNLQKQVVGNARSNANKGKEPSKKQIKQQREEELKALGLKNVVPKKSTQVLQPGQVEGEEEAVADANAPTSSKKEKTLEETLDEMRAKLTGTKTPVNATTFAEWKARKKREKELEDQQKSAKRLADIKAGKAAKTGRELVNFNPELFVDDDDAVETIEREEPEELLEDVEAEALPGQFSNLSVGGSSSSNAGESVPIDESLFQAEDLPDDDEDGDGEDGGDDDDGEEGGDDDDDDDE
eukprot:TRINITY_DN5676_c0_g1_i1.p1 TRINITY_DN5676_c0_g1~~TRINITY_DN5676_c0_g1_i1.p1  ORF type:complete len:276 (+),score=111.40 TRINITY_DN5676_c0_g1_i1:143-970(+)